MRIKKGSTFIARVVDQVPAGSVWGANENLEMFNKVTKFGRFVRMRKYSVVTKRSLSLYRVNFYLFYNDEVPISGFALEESVCKKCFIYTREADISASEDANHFNAIKLMLDHEYTPV